MEIPLMEDEQAETPKTFKDLGLREELVEACDAVGWRAPTKIQVDAIPFALDGTISLCVQFVFISRRLGSWRDRCLEILVPLQCPGLKV